MTAHEAVEKAQDDQFFQFTMTVRQAIDLLNERQCHPMGFHLAMVREDMLEKTDMFGGDSDGDTPHDLMAQTYDWRWGGQPKRGEYTVKLTAGNMRYIGRAIEVYERVLQDRYQKEVFDEIYGKGQFEESIKKTQHSKSNGRTMGVNRMSNQEAIALLRNLEDALDSYCELNEEGKTAFRMAIEALSCSENPNNSDCISRQAAIEATWFEPSYTGPLNVLTEVRDRLKALPSAQPEIIQCRNCKFASGDSRICMKFGHSPIGELDFCAWAERRTDDGE